MPTAATTRPADRPAGLSADAPAVRLRSAALEFAGRDGSVRGLRPTTLEIPRGTLTALVGPNGSGKSTLLALISTAARPTSGDADVLGVTLAPGRRPPGLRALRARLAVCTAHAALDPLLTARENLLFASRLRGRDDRNARRDIDRYAALLGFTDRLDDRVARLSTGLARRVDLARAMAVKADLLLLDEPAGSLDASTTAALYADLAEAAATGTTVIVATHDAVELHHADAVLALRDGVMVTALSRGDARAILALTVARWKWDHVPAEVAPQLRALAGVVHAPGGEALAVVDDADDGGSVTAALRRARVPHTIGPAAAADLPTLAPCLPRAAA